MSRAAWAATNCRPRLGHGRLEIKGNQRLQVPSDIQSGNADRVGLEKDLQMLVCRLEVFDPICDPRGESL